jgi:hypothetical protein
MGWRQWLSVDGFLDESLETIQQVELVGLLDYLS